MDRAIAPSGAKVFKPKLVTVWKEGYGLPELRADALAGLTVAIVALPLSMAIAIASGVSPDRGLYTAVVGGFLVSALGGSRFQIGGPAGAFIVLVSATVAKFGLEGLALTVILSGLMLTAVGLMRLGGLIRKIPHAVTVGFTAGIALTILSGQLKDLFGLALAHEPAEVLPKLLTVARALPTASLPATGLSAAVVIVILALRRWRPAWPALLIAVGAAALAAAALHLPVETIGTRFGGIPSSLPAPHLPEITWAKVVMVMPAALSFTLLGGIESLLSAVVADGMTGRQHRPNAELVAQGIANVGSALFGGISVTGTIARTATNVRAGAKGPVSGMLHSAFLLAFILVAAPLASYIPLPALAGVLVLVAWNMVERGHIAALLRSPAGAAVLAATFGLTVLKDLTAGIVAGCVLTALIAVWRRRARAAESSSPVGRGGDPLA